MSTGSRAWMLGMFQWVRPRTAATVGLVVPTSLHICESASSGPYFRSQAMASGRSPRFDTGV